HGPPGPSASDAPPPAPPARADRPRSAGSAAASRSAPRSARAPRSAVPSRPRPVYCGWPPPAGLHADRRAWLSDRYGTVAALNQAWGTAFWSQRYDDFDEILPPRQAPHHANPTQQLDFARYSSDELLRHYRALRQVLREIT